MAGPLRILALSGSLRAASTNSALLEAARRLAPPSIAITPFSGIGQLPHFSPDLDFPELPLPAAVAAFRALVDLSDGLLIASPEYAHGIPGSFKNALDWLVSGPEFPGKSIALAHATARGTHAHEALCQVLTTMSGKIVDKAIFTVPLMGCTTSADEIAGKAEWASTIRHGLQGFATAIREADPGGGLPQSETGRPMPL